MHLSRLIFSSECNDAWLIVIECVEERVLNECVNSAIESYNGTRSGEATYIGRKYKYVCPLHLNTHVLRR